MRIERLRLVDFRRHESLELSPAPGLTIIRGPNEAGKSTIGQALEAVLFLKAESEAQAIRSLQRWGASGPPTVVLEFEADGSQGRLSKTFAGSKGTAELVIGEEVITDPAAIAERINTLTGIPTVAFYRSTASVGHAELTAVSSGEPLIADRLQAAVSGADRGTAAAKKKLATVISQYRSEGNVNPGRLKVAREDAQRLHAELTSGEGELTALEADRAAMATARDRRIELDDELTQVQAELEQAERAAAIQLRRDQAQADYERDKRGAELVSREAELRRLMPTTMPVAELRALVDEAQELELDVSELDAQLTFSVDAAPDVAAERGPRPWRWVGASALAVLAAAVLSLVLGGLLGLVALVVLLVVAGVFAGGALRAAFKARQHQLSQDLALNAAAERERTASQSQEERRRKAPLLERRLEEIGAADADAAAVLLAEAEKYEAELAAVDGELRGLGVDERDVRRLEISRDRAANEADQARHALAALGDVAPDADAERRRLQAQVDRISPQRDAARSEEDQALGRVESNSVDAESVAILAERLAAATALHTELQARLLVYRGVLEAIEAAEVATLKTAARYLEEHMRPVVERITEGRYAHIDVNEADLAFTVASTEADTLVSAEDLSRGTADQLYLAARLGLVRLVTMDRRPPIILDDPFVTFDAERARTAISILRDVAAEHGVQILFLTWSDRFDREADAVIELPPPPLPPPAAIGEPALDVPTFPSVAVIPTTPAPAAPVPPRAASTAPPAAPTRPGVRKAPPGPPPATPTAPQPTPTPTTPPPATPASPSDPPAPPVAPVWPPPPTKEEPPKRRDPASDPVWRDEPRPGQAPGVGSEPGWPSEDRPQRPAPTPEWPAADAPAQETGRSLWDQFTEEGPEDRS